MAGQAESGRGRAATARTTRWSRSSARSSGSTYRTEAPGAARGELAAVPATRPSRGSPAPARFSHDDLTWRPVRLGAPRWPVTESADVTRHRNVSTVRQPQLLPETRARGSTAPEYDIYSGRHHGRVDLRRRTTTRGAARRRPRVTIRSMSSSQVGRSSITPTTWPAGEHAGVGVALDQPGLEHHRGVRGERHLAEGAALLPSSSRGRPWPAAARTCPESLLELQRAAQRSAPAASPRWSPRAPRRGRCAASGAACRRPWR